MRKIFNGHSIFAVLFLSGLFMFAGAVSAGAVTLFGVNTSNQLVRFESDTPGTLTNIGTITGLQGGENILGIDFRSANGQLFGLGSSSRLYVINTTNAAATPVGGQFSTLLNGTSFGFDFNPTVDRIRVVSNTGQNLRLNPNTGAVTVDGTLNPGSPLITAAAYSNSFGVSTTTTLYDIDTNTDRLLIQSDPNAGTLTDVGPLGVNFEDVNGFDIATGNLNMNPNANTAYAVSASILGTPQLYTINLVSGTATAAGAIGGITNFTPLRGLAASASGATPALNLLDYDGDRRTDFAVFRFSQNAFYINRSSNNSFLAYQFGIAGVDIQTPGDYDNDGRTDIAVWRSSTGVFYVVRSSDNAIQVNQFGLPGDEPVARDYDGDGRTDYAVVRRSGGQLIWYISNSRTNDVRVERFGVSDDIAVPGDYDGDGRFDLGAYRGSGGGGNNGQATYFVQRSTLGFTAINFGLGSDLVVPGDYDGDRRTDYAVVRQGSPFTWYILRSSDGGLNITQFGTKPQYTTQGDYDGDGRTDISVFDPRLGAFYVLRSSDGATSAASFGQNGDYPIANYDTH